MCQQINEEDNKIITTGINTALDHFILSSEVYFVFYWNFREPQMAVVVGKAPIPHLPRSPPKTSQQESSGKVQILPLQRPNTGTHGYHQMSLPQKISFSRLPNIVNRMRRETLSSSRKKWRWYKGDNYVDKNSYTWRNLALFTHYQALLWTRDGAVKRSYTK
ncbi:RB1 [Mytilus edulis]|uniref:RB1 n=1 Tax=Mytilus edulis TaxID=6550 RepID=A0A8S3U782_MYTED|nr:RB1 [Mytilus edulis]